jgi:hypothetical protein
MHSLSTINRMNNPERSDDFWIKRQADNDRTISRFGLSIFGICFAIAGLLTYYMV